MSDGYSAKRGDVWLNEINHTAMCTSPGMLAEFSINENGDIVGGEDGDQTGGESSIRAYYDYPWDGILEWVGGGSSSQPWADVVQWDRNHSRGQVWHTVGTGDYVTVDGVEYPTYTLVNDQTGWALDLTNGTVADGTNIGNYLCNGSDAQAWALVPIDPTFAGSANAYTIRSAINPAYAVAVWNSSIDDGANVLLWSSNYQPGQVWRLYFLGGDSYEIISARSDKAMAAVVVSS